MLVDASCWDASEMESGFMSWCERHVPTWRQQGYDETWIRQRIETAQITRGLHRTLRKQGRTMLEIREELRKVYAAHPELYDLARERGRIHPGLLRYRGNTGDLRQRYTLRVLLYETDKLTYEKFCRWSGLPTPGPGNILTWVKRLRRICPIGALSLELVKFDLQQMDNPEISGLQYQQGTLFGYEIKQYLLEKWERACSYCASQDVPLQVEHIQAKANGGTDRVSNLCMACDSCNKAKGTQDIRVFLA